MAAELAIEAIRRPLKTRVIGSRLVYLPRTTSTQDAARQEAERGAAEGTVVLAEQQTAGRGRFGRPWVSPPGANIYLTVILRPAPQHLSSLSIMAPVAIARAVEAVAGLQPAIKWPNDVMVGERKLAGVLIEAETLGNVPAFALLGIGINVNLDVAAHPEIAASATSLQAATGRPLSRELLITTLLEELEDLYLTPTQLQPAYDEWRRRLVTLGRRVRVSFGGSQEEGIAEDVDAQGNLILRRADGSRIVVAAGDVTLQTQGGAP